MLRPQPLFHALTHIKQGKTDIIYGSDTPAGMTKPARMDRTVRRFFDSKLLVLQRVKMGSCFAVLDFPVELRDVL